MKEAGGIHIKTDHQFLPSRVCCESWNNTIFLCAAAKLEHSASSDYGSHGDEMSSTCRACYAITDKCGLTSMHFIGMCLLHLLVLHLTRLLDSVYRPFGWYYTEIISYRSAQLKDRATVGTTAKDNFHYCESLKYWERQRQPSNIHIWEARAKHRLAFPLEKLK